MAYFWLENVEFLMRLVSFRSYLDEKQATFLPTGLQVFII